MDTRITSHVYARASRHMCTHASRDGTRTGELEEEGLDANMVPLSLVALLEKGGPGVTTFFVLNYSL